ncbi:GFA family protein [Sphingomonas sp. PAMC 26621]|uniref:GFA family protein n=1 Tax=Sphingomonas sp. PAMC 26621 TaxID=1112213 RepID=UPI000289330E|nr:GFA family protein [Sphingomonas sp. PAMC 26621]
MRLTGKCLCGQVHYESNLPSAFMGKCYCKDCSNESGTGHITTVAVPDAGLKLTGILSEYTKMSDDGNRLTKFFCGTCGSTLFTRPEKLQGLVVIRAGTLDDRSVIEPQLQMYVSRAPAWDRPDQNIKSFPEMATEW